MPGGVLDNDPLYFSRFTTAPHGVPYRYLCRATDIKESWTVDSSSTGATIEVYYADQFNAKFDLMGSASFPSLAGGYRLTRYVPYRHPFYPTQFLVRMDLNGYQAAQPPGPGNIIADPQSGFPRFLGGWVQYTLAFWNPPYNVFRDDQVSNSDPTCPAELQRFVRITERYIPQSQKIPTAGFECYDPDGSFQPFVIQEVGSIPVYQIEIVASAIFWPYKNYPRQGIVNCIGKVNSADIRIGTTSVDIGTPDAPGTGLASGGTVYPAGTLLYKGPASEITPYFWIDGSPMTDIPHLFGYRPNGWNKYRRNDGTYFPIRVKGTSATPQFQSADHTQLFEPENPGA